MSLRSALIVAAVLAVTLSCTSTGDREREPRSVPQEQFPSPHVVAAAERERDAALAEMRTRAIGAVANTSSWLSIGPSNISGRTKSILTDPRDPNVLWSGSWAGLWKSTDRGANWQPIDFFVGKFVTALERDPSSPDVIFAGTGPWFGFPTGPGAVHLSTDNGMTWKPLPGIDPACGIHSIDVSPFDSNRILIGTERNIFAFPTCDGGIRLSEDGGGHWRTVMPTDRGVLTTPQSFARFDEFDRNAAIGWIATSTGYQVHYSRDGGVHWEKSAGIDETRISVTLACAPGAVGIVYAVTYDLSGLGTLWKSLDGGQRFRRIPTDLTPLSFDFANSLWVSPEDPNLIVIAGITVHRSVDGGRTLVHLTEGVDRTSALHPHPDIFNIVEASDYRRAGPRQVYLATDGGVYRAEDIVFATARSGWTHLLDGHHSTMYYDIAIGPLGEVFGGMQDTGHAFTDLRSLTTHHVANGDVFEVHSDPEDESVDYLTIWGDLSRCIRHDCGRGLRSPTLPLFWDCRRYTLDPSEPTRMFSGGPAIHRGENVRIDDPPTWTMIRPDSGDCVVAIAMTRRPLETLWFASGRWRSSRLWKSDNALDAVPEWVEVSPGLSGPMTTIYVDPEAPSRVFVATALGDLKETINNGGSWTDRSGSPGAQLPLGVPIRTITRHPMRQEWLYAGTLIGLFISEDGGNTWFPTPDRVLSRVDVRKLVWVPRSTRLVAATHGRGLWWIDIAP